MNFKVFVVGSNAFDRISTRLGLQRIQLWPQEHLSIDLLCPPTILSALDVKLPPADLIDSSLSQTFPIFSTTAAAAVATTKSTKTTTKSTKMGQQ